MEWLSKALKNIHSPNEWGNFLTDLERENETNPLCVTPGHTWTIWIYKNRHCRGSSKNGKWNNSILQKSSQLVLNWINLYIIMYPYFLMISVWHTSATPFNSIICSTLNGVVEAQRLHPQQRRCREMATNMAGAVEVWRHVKTWLKPRKVVTNTWSCSLLVCFLMMIQVLWMINISHFLSFHPMISFFWSCLVGAEIHRQNDPAELRDFCHHLARLTNMNSLCCSHRWTMHLLRQAGPFPGDVGGQSAAGKWSNEIRLD